MQEQKTLQEVLDYIEKDRTETRFIARVFFINNLETYFSFVNTLSDKADISVRISDERFCKGADTVPDLEELMALLDENKDKDILIPNLAEYMRTGELTERKSLCIFSILNRHVHSKHRVWIPIFLAKGLFQSVVGTLDEERFGSYLIEIDCKPSEFTATAYSKIFASQKEILDAVGLREWLRMWDDQTVRSGMSFSTRQIRQIVPTDGDYTLNVVADAFEYLKGFSVNENVKLAKQLGTDEQWASLIPYASENAAMDELIPRALNMQHFDPEQIIGAWSSLSENEKWAFYLWYQLGLNKSSDYISFAVNKSSDFRRLIRNIESAIFDCIDSPNFDDWAKQRENLLNNVSSYSPSREFLDKIDEIEDTRTKLKILTGRSIEERTKILEILSQALNSGRTVNDFRSVLLEKYSDVLLYLKPSSYISGEVNDYMTEYKFNKIADIFSLDLSDRAGQINCLEFNTRGAALHSAKMSSESPYFLWFDGLGIEWMDMLMAKIKKIDHKVSLLKADIGTAVLPTITTVNMDKADPETISEKKIDDLDTLSHIKDKSECNYFSIIVKQFELIESIAGKIVEAINSHPDSEIIVTSDHGLSRMAAIGFHKTQGVMPPSKAQIFNHGRYCILHSENTACNITNTKKDGNVMAFRTHNHFAVQGYAPGEIHGGAAPEELLVPILHFAKSDRRNAAVKQIEYRLASSEIFLGADGFATLSIITKDAADSLSVDFKGKIITGISNDHITWKVMIPGMASGESYTVRVYPNGLYNQKEETVFVKQKGIEIDDDF